MAIELVYRGGTIKEEKVVDVIDNYIAEGNITAEEVGAQKPAIIVNLKRGNPPNTSYVMDREFDELWNANEQGVEVYFRAEGSYKKIPCHFITYQSYRAILAYYLNGMEVNYLEIKDDGSDIRESKYKLTLFQDFRGNSTSCVMSQNYITQELNAIDNTIAQMKKDIKEGGGVGTLFVTVDEEMTKASHSRTEIMNAAYIEKKNVSLMLMGAFFLPLIVVTGDAAVFSATFAYGEIGFVNFTVSVDDEKNVIVEPTELNFTTEEQVIELIGQAFSEIGIAEEGAY